MAEFKVKPEHEFNKWGDAICDGQGCRKSHKRIVYIPDRDLTLCFKCRKAWQTSMGLLHSKTDKNGYVLVYPARPRGHQPKIPTKRLPILEVENEAPGGPLILGDKVCVTK